MRRPSNILWLGVKELRSLASDPVLVLFIIYAFSLSIITQARGVKSEVNNASLAFIDEDESQLSKELIASFFPPQFQRPVLIAPDDASRDMDRGRFMFIVTIPTRFESDLRRGRPTEVQVNVDATAMQQASIGAGYIQGILNDRVSSFILRTDAKLDQPLRVVVRKEFNPNGEASWFTAIVALINQITTLTVVLTGAALIREREHGTIEHLLTLPLTPFEIAISKVWANGLVILMAVSVSMIFVVRGLLHVPIAGSLGLFLFGVVLYLFSATALGLYLGTIARSMAQFALLIILVVIVLQLLSGGNTPVESQPFWMQRLTLLLPSRHFVSFSQAIIFRGAGLETVWPQFLAVSTIGLAFFAFSLRQFRQSISVSK
ncbi:ABC transporter permease [Isosphaeraceae bacterium EP7]